MVTVNRWFGSYPSREEPGTSFCCRSDPDSQVERLRFDDVMAGSNRAEVYIETWSGLVGNFLKSDYDKRWTPENPYSEGPRTWDRENQYWINNDNTYFMRNANYLRLKNIELGYTFNFEGLKKAGISNLRLYTNGTNLITIDGVKDADPEQRDASLGGYPLRKIINFGVQATF